MLKLGDILEDKYEITGQLGAGAMGVVYAGKHKTLGKKVAIKTILGTLASDEDVVMRFQREARAASAIDHPNIVKVFDLGKASDGSLFMVMDHLEGETLGDMFDREGTLDPNLAVALVTQMLSGLGAAHRAGVVHRDFKPANIFLLKIAADSEVSLVKILDFGISKVLEASDSTIPAARSEMDATAAGKVMGTPRYMAPEQVRGLTDIDSRVDIWACGCVLYEALCGHTPFDGNNYHQIMMKIVEDDVVPPSSVKSGIPSALDRVVLKALAKDRKNRYEGAQEMREALFDAVGMSTRMPTSPVITRRTPPQGTTTNADDSMTVQALADSLHDGPPVSLHTGDILLALDLNEGQVPEAPPIKPMILAAALGGICVTLLIATLIALA